MVSQLLIMIFNIIFIARASLFFRRGQIQIQQHFCNRMAIQQSYYGSDFICRRRDEFRRRGICLPTTWSNRIFFPWHHATFLHMKATCVFGHNVKDTRILFGRVPQCREMCRTVIEKVFDLPNTSIKKMLSFSIERRYSYGDGGDLCLNQLKLRLHTMLYSIFK